MSRDRGRLWIVVCAAALALAPVVNAQDMTGAMVTDPPAPVANDVATLTATYENLGPGPANDVFVAMMVPIQSETYPMDSPGFLAMLDSTIGTDTNGNVAFYYDFADYATCNQYLIAMGDPAPPDPLNPYTIPNPFPAGHDGSFSWEMPVIPMEGVSAGRVVITEPANLRNSYSDASAQWTDYDWVQGHAGLYDLISTGVNCNAVVDGCVDLSACFGPRLWAMAPVEGDLEIVVGDNVNWPPDTDTTFGCGTGLVGFTAGKIALMRRGVCTFEEKFWNAEQAGAVGVILANDARCSTQVNYDVNECVISMAEEPTLPFTITIPSVMMSTRQGEELVTAVQGGQTVHAQMGNLPGDHLDVFNWIFSDIADPDILNDYLVTRVPFSLFADGFESGDTSAWSATVP